MPECGAHRLRPAITLCKACVRLPALQGAFVYAGNLTSQAQPRACAVSGLDVKSQTTAIFDEDHASSPLLKIAVTFFDNTSKAAVSLRARSFRSSSRSSSLMRVRSLRVACGLARWSCGSLNAAVALVHHLTNSLGYRPCSRHQALLPASGIAAVVMTACNRAAAVHARPRAGMDCTSSRQRCSVPTPIPTSIATNSTAALSGGNNRATARFLNVCPYRANFFPSSPPPGSWFYRGDNYCDAGGSPGDDNESLRQAAWSEHPLW